MHLFGSSPLVLPNSPNQDHQLLKAESYEKDNNARRDGGAWELFAAKPLPSKYNVLLICYPYPLDPIPAAHTGQHIYFIYKGLKGFSTTDSHVYWIIVALNVSTHIQKR